MKVLYIDIDSLRRDHLGCYGYERPTTPNLDRLAREGARFTNMYAADTPCVPARASIFTGRWGIKTGLLTHGERAQSIGDYGRPEGELDTKPWEQDARYTGPTYPPVGSRVPQVQEFLAIQLAESGFHTAAVSTFADQAPWFRTGWETYYRPQWHRTHSHVHAPEITAHALNWLQDHAQEDFFLYVHYWDPHQSYKAPQAYVDKMLTYAPPDWPSDERIKDDAERYGHMPNSAGSHRIGSKEDFDYWMAMYDAEIAYCDEYVGRLLEALEAAGVLDDTLIIAATDHGENQGEHSVYGDHWGVYETDAHIWMLARWPNGGVQPGTVVDAASYTLDLGPTLCTVGDLEPPARWQGRSLLGMLRGEPEPQPQRDYVYLEHGLWSAQRAIRTIGAPDGRDWKLIKSYHGGLLNWPLTQLFDLANDPREECNVAKDHPKLVRDLEYRLWQWEEEQLQGWPDPLKKIAQEGPQTVVSALQNMRPGVWQWPQEEGHVVPTVRLMR